MRPGIIPQYELSYRNHARYSSPVLPPPPDRPAEWEILLRLAVVAEGRGWSPKHRIRSGFSTSNLPSGPAEPSPRAC